jgi:hypothetical protein
VIENIVKYGFVEVAGIGMWDKYDNYSLEWLKKTLAMNLFNNEEENESF